MMAAAALAALMVSAPAPAYAAAVDNDCVCTLSPGSGAVGTLSASMGDVFVSGADGDIAAPVGTRLFNGSVVSTGSTGSATASFDGGCTVALEGSMQLTITATDGGLCVARIDESLEIGTDNTGLLLGLGAAGIGVTTLLVVGSGTENPASR